MCLLRSSYTGPGLPGHALEELSDGDPDVHGPAVEPASPDRHPLVPQWRPHPHADAGPEGDTGAEVQAGAQQQRLLRVSSQQQRGDVDLHV